MISVNGGHEFRQMYFMWPILRTDVSTNPLNTDSVSFFIIADQSERKGAETTVISDAYNSFNGINGFSNEEFESNEGHHPDQHSVQFIITDTASKEFRILGIKRA